VLSQWHEVLPALGSTSSMHQVQAVSQFNMVAAAGMQGTAVQPAPMQVQAPLPSQPVNQRPVRTTEPGQQPRPTRMMSVKERADAVIDAKHARERGKSKNQDVLHALKEPHLPYRTQAELAEEVESKVK
jgi:hypothetical protein